MLRFIKDVERLVDPINVGTLHFMQSLSGSLPVNVQRKIVEKSAKNNPKMGFIVDPYSYFLAFEITNTKEMTALLPDNFDLAKSSLFEDEEEKYIMILSCFQARTSGFMGNRVEAYAIARDKNTGLLSWVILDYITNTISYDNKNGLTSSNTPGGVITTSYLGDVVVDMQAEKNKIVFTSNIKDMKKAIPNQELWIDGNLSVAYGKKYSETGDVFSLIFNPGEMQTALSVDNIDIEINTFFSQYVNQVPISLLCFEFAQHYVSDSPGSHTYIKNKADLESKLDVLKIDASVAYTSKSFSRLIMFTPICFVIIIVLLLIFK